MRGSRSIVRGEGTNEGGLQNRNGSRARRRQLCMTTPQRRGKPPGELLYGVEAEMALSEVGLTWDDVSWNRKSYSGRVTRWGKISAPVPTDVLKLHVLVHELGHYWLHLELLPDGRKQIVNIPSHIKEYEADQYALRWFERNGIEVTDWLLKSCKFNVRNACAIDFLEGHGLHPGIVAWCEFTTEKLLAGVEQFPQLISIAVQRIADHEARIGNPTLLQPAQPSGLKGMIKRVRTALGFGTR